MAKAKSYIPECCRTITPHLTVNDAAAAIEFYKKAFGAELIGDAHHMDGKIMHAEMKIGDSVFFLNDEFPMGSKSAKSLGGSPVAIHLYVPDADKVWASATAAGARVVMPLMDAFWGDRYGQMADPFGHVWGVATHIEDLTEAEMMERAKNAFAAEGKG